MLFISNGIVMLQIRIIPGINGVLKDMIDIRDELKHCNVLDTDQVEQIINENYVQ